MDLVLTDQFGADGMVVYKSYDASEEPSLAYSAAAEARGFATHAGRSLLRLPLSWLAVRSDDCVILLS